MGNTKIICLYLCRTKQLCCLSPSAFVPRLEWLRGSERLRLIMFLFLTEATSCHSSWLHPPAAVRKWVQPAGEPCPKPCSSASTLTNPGDDSSGGKALNELQSLLFQVREPEPGVILQLLRWRCREADSGATRLGPVSVCSSAAVRDSDERCDKQQWSNTWHFRFSEFLQTQSDVPWGSWQTFCRTVQVLSECLHHRCRRFIGDPWPMSKEERLQLSGDGAAAHRSASLSFTLWRVDFDEGFQWAAANIF